MSLPELSIRRPVMTTLLTLSFIIFGFFAYQKLPVASLPRVDFPTISVTASLPGASPETMANSVAAPLERQFATISSIASLTSTSTTGTTNIVIQFDLDRSIDGAALDVQTAISGALRNLPSDLPTPPTFRKVNPADQPILFLALTSTTQPLSKVYEYAENVLQQQIQQLNGVALVNIFSQARYAVRISANPDALAARGLSINDIRSAVIASDSNLPVGVLRDKKQSITIEATGQMEKASEYTDLVLATRNGVPVKLSDVATVADSVENEENFGWYNDQRAIIVAVYRQSDANTVDTVDLIKSKVEEYRKQLPASVELKLINDRSIPIRQAVEDVEFTLLISIILVILVIFLFLKKLSATLIPALALPVSLIGTFAFMYVLGYSIDNISLLALTLSVGFVVDDAIVMLENIVRYTEQGMKPFEAALKGSREIAFTILSITLSLVAVFIPVFFMGGVVGRVFREFAAVISIAILVSGFVSLTLTPMLCARILTPHQHDTNPNWLTRQIDKFLNALDTGYRISLDFTLRFRLLVVIFTVFSAWYTIHLYATTPADLFPKEDTGLIRAATEGPPDISFEGMVERQKKLIDIVRADPAVDYLAANVGNNGVNQGFMFIVLKDPTKRDPMNTVMARLIKSTNILPGVRFGGFPVQNFQLQVGRASRAAYQYIMTGADLAELTKNAPKLVERMQKIDILKDVSLDLQLTNPQINVDIDREAAARLGVSQEAIRTALFNAYGTRQATTIYKASGSYQVIVEADRTAQDPSSLGHIFVKSAGLGTNASAAGSTGINGTFGQNVPLDGMVSFRRTLGPLAVTRQAQLPAIVISFNTSDAISIGQAVDAIRAAERDINLPSSIATNFTGTAQLFNDAQKGLALLFLAAILVIYIVLGVLYESFIHPITILSGLPTAGLGAVLALKLYGMPLSIIAAIGIILLIGIVKKNAIMMVDFAIERRREGVDALTAIREAALVRFRPIMMTSLAALFGTLPIALGSGAGSELRQPLGIAVVGGLLVSQVLTLYITPAVYFYLDKIDTFFAQGGRKSDGHKKKPVIEPQATPIMGAAHVEISHN